MIATGRPVMRAARGLVSCPHALASAAGVEVLQAGASAVDAAIAAAATLGVVYPHMTSVGGDAFWLIYDAPLNAVRYLGGGGRAAASASIEALRDRGLSEIPYRGVLPGTLTVPGGVASWCEAQFPPGEPRDLLNIETTRTLTARGQASRRGAFADCRSKAQWGSPVAPGPARKEGRQISRPFGRSGLCLWAGLRGMRRHG